MHDETTRSETGQTNDPDGPAWRSRRRLSPVVMFQIIVATLLLAASTAATGDGRDISASGKGVKRLRRGNLSDSSPTTNEPARNEAEAVGDNELNPEPIDPVVSATDELIRLEALRQLDLLDLDDFDARLPPLEDLAEGLTEAVDSEPGGDTGLFRTVPHSDGR
jgi:predicted small secreted protein